MEMEGGMLIGPHRQRQLAIEEEAYASEKSIIICCAMYFKIYFADNAANILLLFV